MKRIYIDMDGVLMNFAKAHREALENNPLQPYPQSQWGFFLNLEPIEYAIYAVVELQKKFDVRFLTAPSTKNPLCYTEKRLSIEKWFGFEACKKLNISEDKSAFKGDFLIDDRIDTHFQSEFEGELIHFNTPKFPNWLAVLDYLKGKE